MIKFHSLAVTLCTLFRCKTVLILGYVVPALLTLPNFFSLSLSPMQEFGYRGRNITVYRMQVTNESLHYINIWFYGIFLKLIPCIVLTILTALLVKALVEAMNRAQRLRQGKSQHHPNGRKEERSAGVSRQKRTDRTTRLLIVILVLFLVTEFPQGILNILSAALGEEFFMDCYTPLGELMDMTALVNCALNFILYCLMSRQFRATGRKIFGLPSKPQNQLQAQQQIPRTHVLPGAPGVLGAPGLPGAPIPQTSSPPQQPNNQDQNNPKKQ